MTKFGDTLRKFRQASDDPDRLNRRLSQERLGELLGREMEDLGYTGAAISEWELGKSKISAADRKVLIALVYVFYKCGGLKTVAEAEHFLRLGNYGALDEEETRRIFQDVPDGVHSQQTVFKEETSAPGRLSWLADMFSMSQEELNQLFAEAEDGPGPPWPRILAAFMRKASDCFLLTMNTILWVAVWLLAIGLMGPSLRFPFQRRDTAFFALVIYAGGSLILPLLIGLLIKTKDSEYWKEQDGVRPWLLRLYTYQGAGIGFNVGYFLVFPLSLARHYLGFQPSIWIEILAATVAVLLGNMAARVVPHNLWRAYKRLTFRDGWIFFIVTLMGPLWAFFFLESYSTILQPVLGIIVILLAFVAVIFIARKSSKTQTS